MFSNPSKSRSPSGIQPKGQKGAKIGVLYDLEAHHVKQSSDLTPDGILSNARLHCGHFKTNYTKIGLQGAELWLPEVMTNAVRQQRTEGVKRILTTMPKAFLCNAQITRCHFNITTNNYISKVIIVCSLAPYRDL